MTDWPTRVQHLRKWQRLLDERDRRFLFVLIGSVIFTALIFLVFMGLAWIGKHL